MQRCAWLATLELQLQAHELHADIVVHTWTHARLLTKHHRLQEQCRVAQTETHELREAVTHEVQAGVTLLGYLPSADTSHISAVTVPKSIMTTLDTMLQVAVT